MNTIKKSLLISFAEKYSSIIIQLVSAIVIARLLTPEEIGIFSVSVVVVGFAHMIRDFGVSNYIVQEKNLTQARIRSAFTVTTIIAWGAAALLYMLSTYISIFFENQAIKEVIIILCLNFLVIPFSSVIYGLLRREMKFSSLFVINTASNLINAATGISLALLGSGYMSLAWAAVAGSLTTVLVCTLLRPENSEYVPSFNEIGRVFSFGSKSSIASMAIELGYNSPDMVIGKMIDFESVGFFSRAMGLASLFNKLIMSAVQSVALPFFAHLNRNENDLSIPITKTMNYLLCLAWPFYGFVVIYAEEIILTLYGDQWTQSIYLAQILCIVFSIRVVPSIYSWIFISIGAINENMIARVIWELSALIFIIPAALFGLEYIAIALIISNLLGYAIYQHYVSKLKLLSQRAHLSVIATNALLSAVLLVIAYVTNLALETQNLGNYLNLIFGGSIYFTFWILVIYLFRHPFKDEINQQFSKLNIPILGSTDAE